MSGLQIFFSAALAVLLGLSFLLSTPERHVPNTAGVSQGLAPPGGPDRLALIMLFAIGVAYLCYIVPGSVFWEPDESKIAYRMMSGNGAALQVFSSGRFFPLGHQLFNFYGKFAESATEFHLLALLPVFASAVCLAVIFSSVAWRYRVWVLLAALSVPSVFYVSQSFIYMERDVIFLLTLFVVFFIRAQHSPGPLNVFITLCSAFLALYHKETAFLIILGFSVARLVAGGWPGSAPLTGHENEPPRRRTLDMVLTALCVVFVLSYFYFTLPIRSGQAYYASHVDVLSALKTALAKDRVFLLFLCFMPVRLALVFSRKVAFHPVWDPLLCGVLLFYAGNLYLTLIGPYAYYLAPGDFLFLVALFGLLAGSRKGMHLIPVVAVCILAVNLPATMGYAKAYKALSADYARSLDFLQQASRKGALSVYVAAENSWPAVGLEAALRQRGLSVKRHDKTLEVISASPGQSGRRAGPESRHLIYVGFYSFWWSDEEYLARLKRYQQPGAGMSQILPSASGRQGRMEHATHIFEKPGDAS